MFLFLHLPTAYLACRGKSDVCKKKNIYIHNTYNIYILYINYILYILYIYIYKHIYIGWNFLCIYLNLHPYICACVPVCVWVCVCVATSHALCTSWDPGNTYNIFPAGMHVRNCSISSLKASGKSSTCVCVCVCVCLCFLVMIYHKTSKLFASLYRVIMGKAYTVTEDYWKYFHQSWTTRRIHQYISWTEGRLQGFSDCRFFSLSISFSLQMLVLPHLPYALKMSLLTWRCCLLHFSATF